MTGEEYYGVHKTPVERFGARSGETVYAFFACLLALGVSGLVAYASKQPLLFPSLGPTVLLFFEQPTATPASPRNALIGHAVAILAGASPWSFSASWTTGTSRRRASRSPGRRPGRSRWR